jgi:hypothetical protein
MTKRPFPNVPTFVRCVLASVVMTSGSPLTANPGRPIIEVRLDDTNPEVAGFTLSGLQGAAFSLSLPKATQAKLIDAPSCSAGVLTQTSARTWIAPPDCVRVTWSAAIPSIEQIKFDASAPTSVWSPKHRFWILTNSLPWLRVDDGPREDIEVVARIRGTLERRRTVLPAGSSAPLYIIAGTPIRHFSARGASIEIFGDVPAGGQADQLQQNLVDTIGGWHRDLEPPGHGPPLDYRFVWFQGPVEGVEPALLIQYVPDPADAHPHEKLKAGVLLTGGHEAFHSFAGWIPGPKPEWFSESIATYFAYEAARRHLRGRSLALAKHLVGALADHSVLHAQDKLDKGDASDYGIFYSRGTRFWQAIDRVLTIRPNRSGKLGALLQRTKGFEGVAWKDPGSIAAFFDGYSGGAAKQIVRCYLIEDSCRDANR